MKRNLLYIGIAMLLGGPMNADEADRIALCRVQDQMTESTKRMVIQDDESDQPVYVENTPIITDHEISSAKMAGGNEVAILFTVTEARENSGIRDQKNVWKTTRDSDQRKTDRRSCRSKPIFNRIHGDGKFRSRLGGIPRAKSERRTERLARHSRSSIFPVDRVAL